MHDNYPNRGPRILHAKNHFMKTTQINIKLPQPEKTAAVSTARKLGLNLSVWLRLAIKKAIKEGVE